MNNTTEIISIDLEPFTSGYRKDCGWYVTVVFKIKKSSIYFQRLCDAIQNHLEVSLVFNKETGVFRYNMAVTETLVTKAALLELQNIKDGIISPKYISPVERYIMQCIEVLDLFWD